MIKLSEQLEQPCPCCGRSGWKPIESLPPVGIHCLFWFDERKEPVVDYLEYLSDSDGGGVQSVHNYLHNYTHWMPLPAPPEKSEE